MKIIAEFLRQAIFKMGEHERFRSALHPLMSDSHNKPEGR
jgi:hypothetical protein